MMDICQEIHDMRSKLQENSPYDGHDSTDQDGDDEESEEDDVINLPQLTKREKKILRRKVNRKNKRMRKQQAKQN